MQIIFGIIAEIISFLLCFFLFPTEAAPSVTAEFGIDIEKSQIEFHEDTHGGFHGDGEEIIIFRPTAEQIEKIQSEWKKTPVDSEIAPFLFCEEEYNGIDLREYILNTDGWWFYKNRSSDTLGYSHNFTFAFFDGEKVYYYELDT